MIDAEDVVLGKCLVESVVELARRDQVAAEGLLQNDARVLRTPRARQTFHHDWKHAGRYRQVMRRQLGVVELGAQGLVGLVVRVVAAHVAEKLTQLGNASGST